jgi:hypothetical protein
MCKYHGPGVSPWYDDSRFARDGTVCVTINYRVGAESFLYLGDGVGNLRLLVQPQGNRALRYDLGGSGRPSIR